MRIARINPIFLLVLLSLPTYAQVRTTTAGGDSHFIETTLDNADADTAAVRPNYEEPAYPDNADSGDEIDAASGSLDDSAGSIEAHRDTRGWSFKGDLRVGNFHTDTDNRDATDQSSSEWLGRFRAGATYSISEKLIVGGRLASTCSTDECDPDFVLDSTLPNQSSINNGDITFDQLYIHSFRREKFDVAIGRLQTKFVSRAGVFAKSLDRNDSSGTNVNWTDGVHGILHVNNDWTGHLILQINQADGTGNIRRGPIDFNNVRSMHQQIRIRISLCGNDV